MIDPRGCRDVIQWADFIVLPLAKIGVTPRQLDLEHEWQDWAYDIVQSQELEKEVPPDPRFFSDWVEWAERFNQTVPY